MEKGPYHHGDLRHALVDASLAAIGEGGMGALSMADAARRAGVSSAAPYRHFTGRQELLAATATALANALGEELEALTAAPSRARDPVELLAGAAGTYTEFFLTRGAGLDLIYSADLTDLNDVQLATAGRRIMDTVLPAAREITSDAIWAIVLLERLFAVAHGYAQLKTAALSPRRLTTARHAVEGAEETVRLIARASING